MERKKPFFATPQDVEAAFYEALERADFEAMAALWAEDEEVVCVHPAGPRLAGYALVMEGWRRIFEGGPRMKIALSGHSATQGLLYAIHSLHENITLAGESEARAPIIATNVYVRAALGWRMLVHHASPAPPQAAGEAPKVLH